MSDGTNGATADAAERFAIGIFFGNSNSSIAFTGPVSLITRIGTVHTSSVAGFLLIIGCEIGWKG